jgi:hypothetical protein
VIRYVTHLFAESHQEIIRFHVAMNEVLPVDEFDPAYLRGNTKLKIVCSILRTNRLDTKFSYIHLVGTLYSMTNNKNLCGLRIINSEIYICIRTYSIHSVKHMYCLSSRE